MRRRLALLLTMMRGSALIAITRRLLATRATATFRNRNRSLSRNWRMHILITADTVGGVWTYCRELVAGLVRRGMRVTLVSFGDLPSVAQSQWMDCLAPEDHARLAYYPTAFKLEWMQDSDNDMKASAEFLLGIIRETSPD